MARKTGITVVDWQETLLKTDLPPNSKYIAMYLRTFMNAKQDMAWPSLARIAGETGLAENTVIKHLNILEQAGWLYKQPGSRVKSNCYFARLPEGINAGTATTEVPQSLREGTATIEVQVPQPLRCNNQENNQRSNQGGRFTPPTVDEVAKYCSQRGNGIDPEEFVNHYEASNWMRGKTKIKNWKACVITWEKSRKKDRPSTEQEVIY